MKIIQLRIITHDLAGQLAFYKDTLGLAAAIQPTTGQLHIQLAQSELIMTQTDDAQAGAYHFAFNIPENQFAQAKAWLAARVKLHAAASGQAEFDFRDWNAHAVYAFDAGGNIIELIARHDLPNASTAPFGAHSLLSISEIGLAVPDVRACVQHLQTQYDLPVYDGAGSDVFTAVGDPHGLFIVVAEHRLWYPDTGIPAQAMPASVTIERAIAEPLTLTF